MKRIILMMLFAFMATASHAQIYKMDRVWRSGMKQFQSKYDSENPDSRTFILFEVKYYMDSIHKYGNQLISVYFEGTVSETWGLLSGMVAFVDDHAHNSDIYIEVDGFKAYKDNRHIYVFEKDGRHVGKFSEKDFLQISKELSKYCEKENIIIE